ncbi:MAG: hypothetical protein HC897_14985, partial [Thermoanaerobaculia bacterium]|nr:hypothetical protein [Thermoanaerobaculia bacterium]
VCGAPILARSLLVNGDPLGLGIAGLRGAGKTALALAMIHQLRRSKVAGQDLVLSGLGDTEARFGTLMHAFFEGQKPGASVPEAPGADGGTQSVSNFCWELALAAQRQRPGMLLSYHDLAGETWGLEIHQNLPRFERYLRLLASLVLVVDGAAVATDLGFPARDAWNAVPRLAENGFAADHQMLATLVDRLGEHAARVNLAIVVSKVDLFWHDDRWRALQLVEGRDPLGEEHQSLLKDLLIKTNRRDLVLASRHKFRNVRLFAVSSLGFRPQTADVRDDRLTRPIEPAGVLTPLEWLLCESWPALRSR